MKTLVKGISVLNPDDVEINYYLKTVDYAIEHGFDHIQLIGPIHNYVRGNIDGMIYYKKYAQFNDERDTAYVDMCLEAVNIATKKASEHGIKNYMWHHELYLPNDFKEAFPEVLNSYGDIEVSHPLIRDFLEEKIKDFFEAYPYMDGVILTLHETSVPLLKLQNQKLGKVERVKYVTETLYRACKALGKELIVRPFASLEEDYEMMTAAYEEISPDLVIMDKWTQFDWSLAMPSNSFFRKIKKNPLLVEGDVFGEYFGKGRLPIMLMKHLKEKFEYCGKFNTTGYVVRIDRNGKNPFGDVNEVNLEITNALLNGANPTEAAQSFLDKRYPGAGKEMMELMMPTEKLITDAFYINAYLFSQLSTFQNINHSKNHFYFEMMRQNACIASDEWFIPKPWQIPSHDEILSVKKAAAEEASVLLQKLEALKNKLSAEDYTVLHTEFANLKYVTQMWYLLAKVFIAYVQYFEGVNTEANFLSAVGAIAACADNGRADLGELFYCDINGISGQNEGLVATFIEEIKTSFEIEKTERKALEAEDLKDFVLCGGGMEGHKLQKEVNFSDVLVYNNKLCRIPGNGLGKAWSAVNAHGWFSYEVAVEAGKENTILIAMENPGGVLSCTVCIGEDVHTINEKAEGMREFSFAYTAGADAVRIRIDRNSAYVPYVYTIKVL